MFIPTHKFVALRNLEASVATSFLKNESFAVRLMEAKRLHYFGSLLPNFNSYGHISLHLVKVWGYSESKQASSLLFEIIFSVL
jgi:hypothetical protein